MNMKKFRMLFFVGLFWFLYSWYRNCPAKKKFNPLTDDITQMMPPMSTLLDSAYATIPG